VGDLTGPTPATVVVVTYQSARYLDEMFTALGADPSGPREVIVVDNASSDGSADVARRAGATVIGLDDNQGFGAGCHAGVEAAGEDVVVFLNPDARPRPGWLPPLLAALGGTGVGAASPTIELADHPGHFNTSGGALTFYGVAWATDVGSPIPHEAGPIETPFPSGAAMAIDIATWRRLGGFRQDMFMYHEDSDLGWRLRLLGLRSVRVPASLVAHDYEFDRHPSKMFYLERNRLLMLRGNYRTRTLLLLAPALLAVELAILALSIRDGWARAKLRSWGAAWRMRHSTRRWRHSIERIVDDSVILAEMQWAPTATQVRVPLSSIAGRLLGAYLRLVRRLA
jgi:GT2 family glycosyltransferase